MAGIIHGVGKSGIEPYHPGEANVIFENGNWYNSDIFDVTISPTTETYMSIDGDGNLVFVPDDDLTHDTGLSIALTESPITNCLTLVWQFTPNIPDVLGGRAFMQYGRCIVGADGYRCMTEGYQRESYIDLATNVIEDYKPDGQMLIGYTNRNNNQHGIFIAGNHFKVNRILGFVSEYSSCGFN